MRRLALTLGLLALLGTFSGCGTSADRLVEQQIMLLEELADAYESGASQAAIDEIRKTMAENDKKLDELKLSEDAKRKVILKHKGELDRANERVNTALKRTQHMDHP